METPDIRRFAHSHCRFKLRSGKEVFGVIWEVETGDAKRLFFSSIRDYERSLHDPLRPIEVVPMEPTEIVYAERLAS
ncbi:MAG TPA: hypothetical protein VGE21_14110 [Flavobacteriales bacterium]